MGKHEMGIIKWNTEKFAEEGYSTLTETFSHKKFFSQWQQKYFISHFYHAWLQL